jgi:hypothetical protein
VLTDLEVRWDPNREDPTFFEQSACLYGAYYTVQIFVHRPFIQTHARSPGVPAGGSFPALAICTNAARASMSIVHTHAARLQRPIPQQIVRARRVFS